MNVILSGFCFLFFLLLAPVLLAFRFFRQRPAWWMIGPLIAVLGWLAWFGAYFFYQLHIGELIEQGAELPEGWDSDGAAGVFALFMGWLISLLYFLPWLAVFLLATLIRGLLRKQGSEDDHDDAV